MTNDHAFMGAVELGKKIARGAVTSADATRAMLERIERLNGSLKCYELVMAEQALSDAKKADREIKAKKVRGPAAWRTPGHQGSLRYRGRADGLRHPDVPVEYRETDLHRGGPAQGRRRGHPRQAATHRRGTRAASSGCSAAGESVAAGSLVRRLLLRLRRGDGSRPLLRLARQRHRRLDPISVACQWLRRAEADLGPRQPLRRLPAVGNAGPYRPHHAPGGRCRGHARRDRRP